ncbi:protein L-Myc-1b [Amia ocellicauda]|uniref:protein L-Myc-1b n=1 Tax=Amia ocellicauda TaxID=2972642 RepID=UPI003464D764
MPGINSSAPRYENWEMEYDRYQHYFYDDHDSEEDFYKSTAPSEDIWKKFELVPTPPMSPIRSIDKLEWVSQFLGQDEEQEGQYKIDTEEIFGNLSSIIIQDCMWSGFSASQRLEKVVNERLSGSAQVRSPHPGQTASAKPQPCPLDTSILNSSATDCVDPAAVLTYPFNSGCKKQASSGSESRTDSEDEEIDVVTVESKQNKHLMNGRKPVTITVRADPHDPCMKRFHISIHQQQHNYAAPSPDTLPEDDPPVAKRIKREPSPEPLLLPPSPAPTPSPEKPSFSPQHSPETMPGSPQSSDTEDTDKRKTHNYLERKRRNDLRSRFLALRDEIPGLVDCPKTPKVVILTKATEYLRLLHASDKHKTQERKQLKSRQQQLLRKLAELKRS